MANVDFMHEMSDSFDALDYYYRVQEQQRRNRLLARNLNQDVTILGGDIILRDNNLVPMSIAPWLNRLNERAQFRTGTYRRLSHNLVIHSDDSATRQTLMTDYSVGLNDMTTHIHDHFSHIGGSTSIRIEHLCRIAWSIEEVRFSMSHANVILACLGCGIGGNYDLQNNSSMEQIRRVIEEL